MSWNWQLLRAGELWLDGGSMFGVVPKGLWARMSPPDDDNRIRLQTNCLLLERDGTRVLIETGYGDKWDDTSRERFRMERRTIADALAEVGCAPTAIEHVILSHLHFDHAGGLTYEQDGELRSRFPEATIHSQRQEWEDALANRSTMSRTYLRTHLDPVADQIQLADGGTELLRGLWVEPAPGHTWGQQAVRFETAEGVVCFPGDVLPTRAHAGPAFSMAYDMLPYTNMETKLALLERAAAERWLLVLDHEPGEPRARVVKDAKGRWALENA